MASYLEFGEKNEFSAYKVTRLPVLAILDIFFENVVLAYYDVITVGK